MFTLDVVYRLKPIFTDKTLLRKCLDGLSQNPNESFNHLIWSICPENKYHGEETVEIAVGLSVIKYNDGMRGCFLFSKNSQLDVGCEGCVSENGQASIQKS